MAPPRTPTDASESDDPDADVSGMIAKVGTESVATVQTPNLIRIIRTRRQRGPVCECYLCG